MPSARENLHTHIDFIFLAFPDWTFGRRNTFGLMPYQARFTETTLNTIIFLTVVFRQCNTRRQRSISAAQHAFIAAFLVHLADWIGTHFWSITLILIVAWLDDYFNFGFVVVVVRLMIVWPVFMVLLIKWWQ